MNTLKSMVICVATDALRVQFDRFELDLPRSVASTANWLGTANPVETHTVRYSSGGGRT